MPVGDFLPFFRAMLGMMIKNGGFWKGGREMKNILELLDRAAEKNPGGRAFADETHAYTWAQAAETVWRAASSLSPACRGRAVGVWMEKTADCVLAMLAVVAAGGWYTVIDPRQPAARTQAVLETLRPAALIAGEADAPSAKATGLPVFSWERLAASRASTTLLSGVRARSLDTDLVYVLFTSGSTGRPKGVAVTHRALLAYSAWACSAFGFDKNTVFGGQSPLWFSMSVTDLYCTLRAGACLELLPKRLFGFPAQLLEYLARRRVNTIYWVPSALGLVAAWDALSAAPLPGLKNVLFAGEVMPPAVLEYWFTRLPGVRFANLYGPTETTDICTWYEVKSLPPPGQSLPIGRPCDNCGVLLLDENDREALPGQVGEVCVRGSFLAAGYYRDEAATAKSFTRNPLNPALPEVIYRTGDLARMDTSGLLHYLGRRDSQIKMRGCRIEPGEVEAAAQALTGVELCACLYDRPRDRLILAYQSRAPMEEALRMALTERLPAYMRPAKLTHFYALPLGASGKLDRTAALEQALRKEGIALGEYDGNDHGPGAGAGARPEHQPGWRAGAQRRAGQHPGHHPGP